MANQARGRILVVDDTPENLEVITGLLEPLGHEVAVAASGERALRIVERLRPDMILLDVMMPGIDGFETCRRLKQNPATARIPVIFVTGRGDDVDGGFAAGGVDYIVKPVREHELCARVSAHLAIAALLRELEQKNLGLEQARRELEQRVQERTRELSIANRNLNAEVVERRQAEDQLQFLARHDFLTRLLNRNAFTETLNVLLARLDADQLEHTLLCIDVDQFKIVNDVCGHVAGDELLREVAELLKSVLDPEAILARLGGDEFAALLHGAPLERGIRIADAIRERIEKHRFVWREHTFSCAVSIGVAAVQRGCDSSDRLLSMADTARFTAKEEGRNRVHVYDLAHSEVQRAHHQMHIAPRLTRAIEQERFALYRQAIRPLGQPAQGEHFEVLLRLREDDGSLLAPGAFIPAAERFGLMPQIDRVVLRRLFRHYRENPAELAGLELCAINLSGLSVCDPQFDAFLEDLIRQGGVPPGRLCFEITETAAVTNLPMTVRFMHKFIRLGIRFALDDFGSGMSSYAYLKTLPVEQIKIDGMFVKDMLNDPVDRAMVRSINEIAQVMGRQTIAEYAEDERIIQALAEIGVDYAQGYGVERPRPFLD